MFSDGSFDGESPFLKIANTYTLTENFVGNIRIECDNIVLDGAGFTVQGGLTLLGCSNVTIQNFEVTDGYVGHGYLLEMCSSNAITLCNNRLHDGILYFSLTDSMICGNNMSNVEFQSNEFKHNTIRGNFISQGSGIDLGIQHSQPSYNYIAENIILNATYGICIGDPDTDLDGWNNTVTKNLIVNNDIGIMLGTCRYAFVYDNNVINNDVGIACRNLEGWTRYNYIYHNNFINNTQQVEIILADNPLDTCYWDNGYPSGGNYWSDYNGSDNYSGIFQNETGSDGLGDTIIVFDADNRDHYPYMEPVPTAPYPLFAYFICRPAHLTVNHEITFDASLTYDQDIISYHWDFGENNTVTQQTSTITHVFPSHGWYPVTVTVTDRHGKNASYTDILFIQMPTDLSITTTSSSSAIGFVTTINGSLTDVYSTGLSSEIIRLFYRDNNIDTWNPISSTLTDQYGQYAFNWIPIATGNFTLKAVWDGNTTHIGKTSTTNLNSLLYSDQYVFSVESNSTITHLAFNTGNWQLRFTATGPSDTSGWVKVTMAKTLVTNIDAVQVYFDHNPVHYTYSSLEDSWVLQLSYSHSTHAIILDLNQPGLNLGGSLSSGLLIIVGILCGIAISFTVMKFKLRPTI